MMSKFYIMVEDHRLAVASADTRDEINKSYLELSEYEGYKDKMIILERCVPMNNMGAPDCGYPALTESEVNGEE